MSIMLRTYFLHHWFGLSDPGMEEAFCELAVLQRFAGVDLGVAAAPDETPILHFRHLLEQHILCGQMLDTVNHNLECKGSHERWLVPEGPQRASRPYLTKPPRPALVVRRWLR